MEAQGTEPQFKKEDVWAVAQVVAEEWRRSGGDRPDYCAYCYVKFGWNTLLDTVVHHSDCVVLIARDLLTGRPAGKLGEQEHAETT